MRILTIDDDTDQLKSLSLNLRSSGYEIDAMDNVSEAVRFLKKAYNRIDLIITDYAMPGISGLALVKIIRTKYPETPVIMISAMGTPELENTSVLNGCDGFVSKPFKLEELIGEINRVMTHRSY